MAERFVFIVVLYFLTLSCSVQADDESCADDEYTCSIKHECVDGSYRCDGEPDCKDKSDEDNCESCKGEANFCVGTSQCVADDERCDGFPDCPDGSDEANCDCIKDGDFYKCTCIDGYEGDRCQTNIDDCANNPCINDAVCTDGVASYECTCALKTKPSTCETSGFIQHKGKHISWGTPQDPSVTSVAKCAKLCREDDNCTFFDFNFGYFANEYVGPYHGSACWLHDVSKSLKNLIKADMTVDSFEKNSKEVEEEDVKKDGEEEN